MLINIELICGAMLGFEFLQSDNALIIDLFLLRVVVFFGVDVESDEA